MLLSTFSSVTAVLLLSAQLLPVTASIAAVDVEMRDITAKDFKTLVVAASSPHGAKRALLQSAAFSQDFFDILEPILVGNTDGASQAIATASAAGDTTAIANAFSLSFAFGYAVPAAYAAAAAIQLGSPNTCNNYAAAAYISALTNAIAISNTEAAAQAIYAAFTLGCSISNTAALAVANAIADNGCGKVQGILTRAQSIAYYAGESSVFAFAAAQADSISTCLLAASTSADSTVQALATALASGNAQAAGQAYAAALQKGGSAAAAATTVLSTAIASVNCNGVISTAIATAKASASGPFATASANAKAVATCAASPVIAPGAPAAPAPPGTAATQVHPQLCLHLLQPPAPLPVH
ncbi:MAG: hypothetical protein FRX49_13492, partial [Trebouxia sp. A1-2]